MTRIGLDPRRITPGRDGSSSPIAQDLYSQLIYEGKALATAAGAAPAALADAALQGRLTVYVGAGVSAASPTDLPGAAALAKRLYDHLAQTISMDGVDEWALIEVADRVASEPAGTQLLRSSILRVADMTRARYSYAHAVLGLLLCEGAATVIETNYDDCIERSAFPERLSVAVTASDRINMQIGALLKVHGCATRPSTMLVTSNDLASPPLFASAELAARLSSGDVVFIGIGSLADYVRSSLDQVVKSVGMERLTVVDPKMADWKETEWPSVLKGLHSSKRIADDAGAFCDALLHAYLMKMRTELRSRVAQMKADHPQRLGIETILKALEERTSVWVLRWLRAMAWGFGVGRSVAVASREFQALLALGCLVGDSPLTVSSAGWLRLMDEHTDARMTALVSDSVPLGGEMALEAHRRVNDARTEDRVPSGADIIVVCCGQVGPLGSEEAADSRGLRAAKLLESYDYAAGTPNNILDEGEPDHLIDSITAGRVFLVAGEQIIEAA